MRVHSRERAVARAVARVAAPLFSGTRRRCSRVTQRAADPQQVDVPARHSHRPHGSTGGDCVHTAPRSSGLDIPPQRREGCWSADRSSSLTLLRIQLNGQLKLLSIVYRHTRDTALEPPPLPLSGALSPEWCVTTHHSTRSAPLNGLGAGAGACRNLRSDISSLLVDMILVNAGQTLVRRLHVDFLRVGTATCPCC